jgi:hypothetical protein
MSLTHVDCIRRDSIRLLENIHTCAYNADGMASLTQIGRINAYLQSAKLLREERSDVTSRENPRERKRWQGLYIKMMREFL